VFLVTGIPDRKAKISLFAYKIIILRCQWPSCRAEKSIQHPEVPEDLGGPKEHSAVSKIRSFPRISSYSFSTQSITPQGTFLAHTRKKRFCMRCRKTRTGLLAGTKGWDRAAKQKTGALGWHWSSGPCD
jgi:hypothetical protein